MSIHRDESEPGSDPDPPVDSNDDGADPDTVPVPAELIANLPPDILATFPPEIQAQLRRDAGDGGIVMQRFSASASMMLGSIVNPIASQINSQHITDIIGLTSPEVDHEYNDRKHSRLVWAISIGFAVAVLLALSIVLALSGMGELLLDVFKGIAIFAGGFGGGYGFSALRRR